MPIYLLTESGAQFHGHLLASSGDSLMLQLILINTLDPHGQISERSRSGVVKIDLLHNLN